MDDYQRRTSARQSGAEQVNDTGRSQPRGGRLRSLILTLLFAVACAAVFLLLLTIFVSAKLGWKIDWGSASMSAVELDAIPVVTATPAPTQRLMPRTTISVPADLAPYYPAYSVKSGVPDTEEALGLPESPKVPESYFDDAVFVGDSVTLKLKFFTENLRKKGMSCLGNAQFFVAGSMSIKNALGEVSDKAILPSYKGRKMHIEDAIAQMGAKKVFIMLGMNDISLREAEENAQNMMLLISRIKEKNPDALIFVQSCTPRVAGDYDRLNNDRLFEFDLYLYEYCKQYAENGIFFIDIAHAVRDEKGDLPEKYCGDMNSLRLHFSNKACELWLKYLYTHALNV